MKTNESQLKNPDISSALYTLRIQYSYTQTQCEDGARDVRVFLLTPVRMNSRIFTNSPFIWFLKFLTKIVIVEIVIVRKIAKIIVKIRECTHFLWCSVKMTIDLEIEPTLKSFIIWKRPFCILSSEKLLKGPASRFFSGESS